MTNNIIKLIIIIFTGMGKDNNYNDLVVDITIANPYCPSYLHHPRYIEKYALTQLVYHFIIA
jgi:hypothetical protein